MSNCCHLSIITILWVFTKTLHQTNWSQNLFYLNNFWLNIPSNHHYIKSKILSFLVFFNILYFNSFFSWFLISSWSPLDLTLTCFPGTSINQLYDELNKHFIYFCPKKLRSKLILDNVQKVVLLFVNNLVSSPIPPIY